MQLAVAPADLAAAAATLRAARARLDDDVRVFRGVAARELPDVGSSAIDAAARSADRTAAAVGAFVTDLGRLADALATLAELYRAVDLEAAGRR